MWKRRIVAHTTISGIEAFILEEQKMMRLKVALASDGNLLKRKSRWKDWAINTSFKYSGLLVPTWRHFEQVGLRTVVGRNQDFREIALPSPDQGVTLPVRYD